MIVYFPFPYPDENFYSWLARYIKHSLTTSNLAAKELFDTADYEYSFDLPNRISVFTQRIRHLQNIPCNDVIQKHTLWPFYSFFLKKTNYVFSYKNLTNSRHANFRRMIRGEFEPIISPRYCPTCLIEDEKKYGEFYWHRSHQLPFMCLCPKHLCSLKICLQNVSSGRRIEFVLPTKENCPAESVISNNNPWILGITSYLNDVLHGNGKDFPCPNTGTDFDCTEFFRTGLGIYWHIHGRIERASKEG